LVDYNFFTYMNNGGFIIPATKTRRHKEKKQMLYITFVIQWLICFTFYHCLIN